MTIHETYEKWKHLDYKLSDKHQWIGETWRDAILFDLWQAVKAEAAKEQPKGVDIQEPQCPPIDGYWLCVDCETVHPYHYLRLSTVACKCGIGKGRWEAHPFQIKEAPCLPI